MVDRRTPNRKSSKATERIDAIALDLLEQHPEGLRWSKLVSMVLVTEPTLHPKTVNGRVWKLVENYPELVRKPSRGLFRLLKYG